MYNPLSDDFKAASAAFTSIVVEWGRQKRSPVDLAMALINVGVRVASAARMDRRKVIECIEAEWDLLERSGRGGANSGGNEGGAARPS